MYEKIIKTFSSNVLSIVFGFISSILIARLLGPEDNGHLVMMILIPNTLYILVSGQYFSDSTYFIRKKIYSLEEVISSSIYMFFLILILEYLVLYLYSLFSNQSNYLFILIMIILINLLNFINPLLIAIDKINLKNKLTVLNNVILLIGIIIIYFLVNNPYLESILLLYCISYGIINFIGLKEIVKCLQNKLNFNYKYNLFIVKDIIKFTKNCYISNLVNYLNYRIDQWMIMGFFGDTLLGIYSVAVSLSEKFWIIPDAISMIVYPEVASNTSKKVIKNINRMLILCIIIGIIGWLLIILFIDSIVLFLYGEEYIGLGSLMKILFPGIIIFSFVKIIASYFTGIGKPHLRVKWAIISTVINLVGNIILVPQYNIYGAAITTTISYSLYGIGLFLLYVRETKMEI